MVEAFNIPVLICDGYEADDIIGTLVRRAEKEGFQSYMVTSDKDFGQLITPNTFIYKPSRSGEGVEIIGLPEIQSRWGVQRPEQVVDVLALMGDASDNIPGVPGIGEKTAMKLIAQYGTVDNLLAHAGELTGRVKQTLETNREQALLSKRLATIICDAPCPVELDALKVQPPDEEKLKDCWWSSSSTPLGGACSARSSRRGEGGKSKAEVGSQSSRGTPGRRGRRAVGAGVGDGRRVRTSRSRAGRQREPEDHCRRAARVSFGGLACRAGEAHPDACKARRASASTLETTSLDPKEARLVGLAFSFAPHTGYYVPVPQDAAEANASAGRVPARAGIRQHREGRAQSQVRPERAQVARHFGGREALRHDGGAQPDRAGDAARHGLPVRGLPGLHAGADQQADWGREGGPAQHGRCAGGEGRPSTPPRTPT